jgi:hypothetical protein
MKGFLFCRMGVGLLWRKKKGWCESQSSRLMPVELEKELEREPGRLSDARGDGKRGRAGIRSAV